MGETVNEAQCPDCGEWFDYGVASVEEPCEGCQIVRLTAQLASSQAAREERERWLKVHIEQKHQAQDERDKAERRYEELREAVAEWANDHSPNRDITLLAALSPEPEGGTE